MRIDCLVLPGWIEIGWPKNPSSCLSLVYVSYLEQGGKKIFQQGPRVLHALEEGIFEVQMYPRSPLVGQKTSKFFERGPKFQS